MEINKTSASNVGNGAKSFVAAKLQDFGCDIELPKGNKNLIIVKSKGGNQEMRIRVRSRRTGNWQISTTEGRSPQEKVEDREFWVLVDFTVSSSNPDYYIMPGSFLRRNIYEEHQKYLMLHGGTRPVTPKSTHHLIRDEFIDPWKDRWDILGLR